MSKDTDFWDEHIIDSKINPRCIDISDQAGHSFYNNELDIWFEPDETVFPEGCDEWGLNDLVAKNGISELKSLICCKKVQLIILTILMAMIGIINTLCQTKIK